MGGINLLAFLSFFFDLSKFFFLKKSFHQLCQRKATKKLLHDPHNANTSKGISPIENEFLQENGIKQVFEPIFYVFFKPKKKKLKIYIRIVLMNH